MANDGPDFKMGRAEIQPGSLIPRKVEPIKLKVALKACPDCEHYKKRLDEISPLFESMVKAHKAELEQAEKDRDAARARCSELEKQRDAGQILAMGYSLENTQGNYPLTACGGFLI